MYITTFKHVNFTFYATNMRIWWGCEYKNDQQQLCLRFPQFQITSYRKIRLLFVWSCNSISCIYTECRHNSQLAVRLITLCQKEKSASTSATYWDALASYGYARIHVYGRESHFPSHNVHMYTCMYSWHVIWVCKNNAPIHIFIIIYVMILEHSADRRRQCRWQIVCRRKGAKARCKVAGEWRSKTRLNARFYECLSGLSAFCCWSTNTFYCVKCCRTYRPFI